MFYFIVALPIGFFLDNRQGSRIKKAGWQRQLDAPARYYKKGQPTSIKASCPMKLSRQRPTLPHRCQCSTIGAEGLNFSVRNGKRCGSFAMITGKVMRTSGHRFAKDLT